MSADIRNIAVIAHVDHGKTTLVDAMLKQTHTFRENENEMQQERIMDSNDLEREKGITILSKNTSVFYKGVKINIIDTPGHADFGGEVERVLNMADGALLIVDAAEGPLSQTKFVLKKALEFGLKIILVINKIDRKDARVAEVIRDTENLFLTVVADDDLLDFPVIYAIGRDGKTFDKMPESMEEKGDTTPLFEKILSYIPSARVKVDKPFQMQISAFDKNEYLGNLALGRISQGKVRKNDFVSLITPAQKLVGNYRIEKMYVNEGIKKVEATEAESGEIVYLAGISDIKIGETITDTHFQVALPTINISEPTIKASFGPNTSVFARDEAKFLTSRELKQRLLEEVETNLGMKVEDDKTDSIRMIVAGRGELHLAILIEKLRREGYAMEVGKPEVIYKIVEGKTLEPFSEVIIIVPDNFVGVVTTEMGKRKSQMLDMVSDEKMGTKATYRISERNALGLRSKLMTDTRGSVAITFLSLGYELKGDDLKRERNGVLIADKSGKALSFGLDIAQKRGITFVEPTEGVYEGQIVGLRPVIGDLEINVCKGKQLTNMRSSGNDDAIILAPAVKYSIEEALDFIESDELIDVTSKSVRLRKKFLTRIDRTRAGRKG
ncbi:translational GTPase TypA [Candidatus Shapirobacteria bacterium CG06_land_8_20_14_3_00_40_12]|uniref:Translational GTPase TypA n=1 Tax=Candidatus Shapirobacteria bacterium CG06_land_8_20_14_3_00_40_12 TaxID=1974881 RepID=A0A2M7ASU8_9BACT|nr:MAG: translational GTPase TypA [Candidatus Shapirobacteria bacterium CG06_land_8_20_14_3_00_40_12]